MKKLSLIFGVFFVCVVAALAWGRANSIETDALKLVPEEEKTTAEIKEEIVEPPLAQQEPVKAADLKKIASPSGKKRQTRPHNKGYRAPYPEDGKVYYVRSVTSNNANYKTRFSILHETPSPKRVAGERLYNLSDEAFKLRAKGNRLYLQDSPVFYLTGINSAKGNTGELRLKEGGYLEVKEYSPRFRGYWDADGTGENPLKVTPSRLVSGELPARIVTRKANGEVVTEEDHMLTFKAMAVGPYNGYWSDGQDMNVWLWGMSRSKVKSKEFTYLGLDLGVSTFGAAPTGAIAPVRDPVSPAVDMTTGPTESIGTGRNFAGPVNTPQTFQPFVATPVPGGIVPTPLPPINIPPIDVCIENPNAPECREDPCIENPNAPGCRDICIENPNAPECQEDPCTLFPNNPECDKCVLHPEDPDCNPTEVSEPAATLPALIALLGALGIRMRRRKITAG